MSGCDYDSQCTWLQIHFKKLLDVFSFSLELRYFQLLCIVGEYSTTKELHASLLERIGYTSLYVQVYTHS